MTHSNDAQATGEPIVELVQTGQNSTTELNERELDLVRGGTEVAKVTSVSKAITADKQQAAVMAFVRG